MNTYEIRAIRPTKKTITKRITASSAKYAEKKFRRNHRKGFEELQITRIQQGGGSS